ncbi:MAG: alkaline phosphatase [Isosphaeraceae bacterium]|nr:alkaline phosphatase [Isosphaeraceae bacterium]
MQLPRSTSILLAALAMLSSSERSRAADPATAKHVVVIGVDGLSPDGVVKAETPVLDRLMKQGASSLRARAVMPTVSSPNWASMITGAGPEQHGVTSNDWRVNKFEIEATAKGKTGYFPSIFTLLREQRPVARIAVIHDWDGFKHLFDNALPNFLANPKGPVETTKQAVEQIVATKPTLTFVHLDHVDGAGHEHGHGSPQYYASVEEADRLIGEILAAIEKAGIADDTLVIVTSDHGGLGKKHGGATMVEIEIPWIAKGPGIAVGKTIDAPINTYDTAATVAHALGLERPACWIARPVREAFVAKP